jgi:hypothetical protein
MTKPPDETPLDLIRNALAGLRYGEVVLKVENGEVTMIERTDKIRPRTQRR